MVPRPSLSNRRVAILSVALGLLLLTAPLWIGVFDLQESVTTYEREEVTTEGEAIRYATSPPGIRYPVLSEDLGCTLGQPRATMRLCAHEAALATGQERPVITWTDGPDANVLSPAIRYRYVQVEEAVYEPTADVADGPGDPPADETDRYPVYLDLERVDPATALADLSVPVEADRVPGVVRSAAREGSATTRGTVDAPPHPIRLADGSIYRVVLDERGDPPAWSSILHSLAVYLAPVFGLLAIHAAWRRVEVTVTYREPRW